MNVEFKNKTKTTVKLRSWSEGAYTNAIVSETKRYPYIKDAGETPVPPTELIFWTALPKATIEPNTKLTISNNVLTVDHYTSDNTTYYNKVSGTKVDGYIPLTAGTKIRLQSTGRDHDGATFVMTDNNMNVIWTSGINTKVEELTVMDIPAGATRLYYTEYLNQRFVVDTQISDDGRLNVPTQTQLDNNYTLSVATQGAKSIYPSLKACFTFVLDDAISSIDQTYAIFKTNGIKTCSAAIYRNLRNVASLGGQCVIDVVKDMVSDGGEVLSHNGGALTSETQAENSFSYNKITQRVLQDYGFNPQTIILAGGEGQDTINFLQAEKWSRMYYKMSDKYGLVEPYKHDRVGFASYNDVNAFKTSVDRAITSGEWVVYYMHGIDKETTVATFLNAALAYVASKVDSGDAEIKTYSEVYSSYYRIDPHLKGTGTIGTAEDLAWYYYEDSKTLRIDNNYKYGGVDIVSVTASDYHTDAEKIIINQTYPTRSTGILAGAFTAFTSLNEFIYDGYTANPRASILNNLYLPSSVTSIKVSWSESQGAINPATVGAPNATVTYNYTA